MSHGAMNLNLLVFDEMEKEQKKNEEAISNPDQDHEPTNKKANAGVTKKGGRKKVVEEKELEVAKDENGNVGADVGKENERKESGKSPKKTAKEESKQKESENSPESNLKRSARKRNKLSEIIKLENQEDESVNEEIAEDLSDEEYNAKKGIGKSSKKSKKKQKKNLGENKTERNNNANNIEEDNAENVEANLPTETVIDLTDLNSKENITNTDMIFAIIEICINAHKYGINADNKTRDFWKQVYDKTSWYNILKKFQSETLRKYWRIIRDINDYKQIIDIANSYAEKLNAPNVRLLPVINAISYFTASNESSFDPFISQLTSQQNLSVNTKEMKKLSGGTWTPTTTKTKKSNKGKTSEPALSKKRKREKAIIEDVEEINKKIQESNKRKIMSDEEGKDEEQDKKGNVNEVVEISASKKKARKPKAKTNADEAEQKVEAAPEVQVEVEIHHDNSS